MQYYRYYYVTYLFLGNGYRASHFVTSFVENANGFLKKYGQRPFMIFLQVDLWNDIIGV